MNAVELNSWLDQRIGAATGQPFIGARPEHFITRERGALTIRPGVVLENIPVQIVGLNGLAFLIQGAN